MAITDLDGHFQETNPAYNQLVGRAEQELQRETILSLTHPDDRATSQENLTRLLAEEIPSFVLEMRYVRPSGEAVWVRSSFSLLKDEDGRPSHVILICNDITERRRAERMLIESEKLATVGQLAYSIAHEINNPLEAVLNLLYLAKESKSVEEARPYAERAEDEIQSIARIASQTLGFRKEQTKPVLTRVGDLLDSVLTLYKGKLAQARVRVDLRTRDAPELICYPGEIRQVFANLLRNAVDAMPNGGDLRLRLRPGTCWHRSAPGVRITVADTGHGMDPETRARIYEPFFTTKGNEGTGLGLWVTSTILAKHHGRMHVRSRKAPHKSGTAFTICLPREGAHGELAGLGI